MKWVDLLKATDVEYKEYSKYNSLYSGLIKTMSEKVKNKEWVFPVSNIHYDETMKRMWEKSRTLLAETIGIYVGANQMDLFPNYCDFELYHCLIKPNDINDMKDYIFNNLYEKTINRIKDNDASHIFNSFDNDTITDILEDAFSRNLFKKRIVSDYSEANFNDIIKSEEHIYDLLKSMQKYIIALPKENQARNRALYAALFQYYYSERSLPLCLYLMRNNLLNIEFLRDIPSLNVFAEFMHDILNSNKEVEKNDQKDIRFLATAIPYCDVVITEKKWCNLAKKHNFDTKYNTTISKNIDTLLSI